MIRLLFALAELMFMATEDVVILGGARTPMAEYVGAFKDVSALELGAHAARAALERVAASQPALGRPRRHGQRAADLGRRDLRRPPRRPQGRACPSKSRRSP